MIYGYYLSAQGAEAAAMRQSVLANNLANAGTTAFKPDVPVFRAHFPHDVERQQATEPPDTINEQTGGISLAGTVTNLNQGSLSITNGPLDLALMGPGFFQVKDGDQTLLTRNGRFALDPNNRVVTADDGLPVLSADEQEIVIPPVATNVVIAGDGTVQIGLPGGGSQVLTQIGMVDVADPLQLMKLGASLYEPLDIVEPALNAVVRQGVLEESAAEPVTGMVELIQSSKSFEMNMSMIKYQDEMLGNLLQSIPRR